MGMKVLVTGAGALLGQGIIRSLQNSALEPEIVAADPSPLAAGLYWTNLRYIIPMASDPEYLNVIRRILSVERPDIILIGTDVELMAFAQVKDAIEEEFDTKVIVSSPKAISIAEDKYLTYQFLRNNGFAPPESRTAEFANELVVKFGFPLIVKPRIGARSVGFQIIRSEDELQRAIENSSDLVVQELVGVESEEYTAGTITFGSSCNASILMRRDLRDGNTYRAQTVRRKDLDDQIRAIAVALNAYGPANFQFRLSDNLVRVFEINCRFSGTTPLRSIAGFNEVDMVLRRVLFGEPVAQPQIQDMMIMRHWSETAILNSNLVHDGLQIV